MTSTPGELTSVNRATLIGHRYPDGQWGALRIADGKILDMEPGRDLLESGEPQRWIVPGFFDLQVNGFAGRNFTDPDVTVEDVQHIARAVLRTGTTRFLPTIVTAGLDVMCRQLAVIADVIRRDPLVSAMCPGIHVEGPFIHPEDGPRGAHAREHVREPGLADFDRLAEAGAGKIALITLAPERPGALDLIRHARACGTVVALGHHRAGPDVLEAAIEAGATLCTHLGNGTDALLPRHDNYVWNQLGEDRLWASFIADGHHLPPATLRCMLRAKTPARSVLITDAISAAGMPPGLYRLGDTEVQRMPTGRVLLPGTPFQAGSSADMPTVIHRAVLDGGVSFIDAIAMASIRPETLMSDWVTPWSADKGRPANLVELDWHQADGTLTIRQVVLGEAACQAAVTQGG